MSDSAPTDAPRPIAEVEPPDEMQLLGHDIRSAVSDVIGGLRLIQRDGLPDPCLAQFDRVQAASEVLARLVEELLGGTPGDTVGEVGNLNLPRFLDDELRRWHGVAQAMDVKVTLDRNANLPDIVRLPLLQLRRILANLMGNALRHSNGTKVVLGAELYRDRTLSICITDNGGGFAPDLLPRLFDAGVRGDGGQPGTGMGLHIASAHAQALGGRLTVGNLPTGGARVTLTIPEAIWMRPADTSDSLPDLSGSRILVADDTATNRLLIQGMLTRMGAECEFARDGIEAMNWLARERFDLALVDIEMPTLGGLDVIRAERLRQARGVAPPTAMVAMTAYVLRDNRDAMIEAGAEGILAKPIGNIEMFGRAIAAWLAAAPDAAKWRPESAPALSAATLAELMMAAGPDHQVELVARLREDLDLVDRHLRDAVETGDMSAIRSQTHVLLSLSSAVGALPTQTAARKLNRACHEDDAEVVRAATLTCLDCLAALRAELAETV
ncbi:hybrid sensor histidine kinase/response regulator [Jannaschia pohangensis]|uniref:histidine kinase n=1 Tax=Jannaschia pohangensis TaxID=390807 RepID=A0A1I3IB91_9RHOB|nr:ATP-binding protein [Jannaschia pohangensis]SFI45110.1 Histidine kinase-, DNA gyrase B-, and HSP90-like ATPase [Jannaschia pohangensis]